MTAPDRPDGSVLTGQEEGGRSPPLRSGSRHSGSAPSPSGSRPSASTANAGDLYDVINPSDPVTMRARSFEAALIATLLVGGGKYAAEPVDHDGERVPIFILGGFDEWFAKRYPGKELSALMAEHEADVAAALRSFCTGSAKDRRLFDSALAAITDDEKRKAFIAEWDDQRRSSLNQITNRAHAHAQAIEARRAATAKTGAVEDESAVGNADAPKSGGNHA